MTSNTSINRHSLYRFLNIVEKVGNKLPDPSILFS